MDNNFINKKNITLFFRDVYGTVDDGFTEEECKEFSKLLEELIHQNGSDYLMFGMASTEDPLIVDDYENRLTEFFERNVILLPKLPENKMLNEAKIAFIVKYINHLLENYDIKEIYLADDSELNHYMLCDILLELTGIELQSIIPNENNNNLRFINNSIKEILISRSFNKVVK